jgi:hypothetical protein
MWAQQEVDGCFDGNLRSQLDRLLDPESGAVTLKSLMRAARLVGKKIKIDLVDAA